MEHINWASIGEAAQVFDPHLSIFLRPEMITIGPGARIDGCVKIEGGFGVFIGAGCHISSFAHLNVGGGRLIIGENAAITSGACIISGSNTTEGQAMSSAAPPEMQVIKRTTVRIGAFAMVAAHAVILPGVTVGDFAVVAAGAVVTHDIPEFEVWGGVPAKFIKMRDVVVR